MNFHLWAPAFSGFGGGITAFSRELAFALNELGHGLRLLGKLDRPGVWNGFPLWGAGDSAEFMQTPRYAIGALAACARHRPEHVIGTHLNFGPVAHAAKRAFGTPYTLVAHGIDVNERLSSARRTALGAADRVIAVSAWTRQRLQDLGGIEPGRIVVVPNTVDEARFSVAARPEKLASRYNLQPGEKVVLTVARLDAREGYKGYDRIVRALPAVRAACGPVRFILAGKGDDRTRVQEIARNLGIEHAVTCAGFVADEEMADHYRLADVFAMPSTGEGFGIVFLEALACGTPVVAGNCDGSVDALDGGRLGRLVDPMSVEAIGAAIIGLLQGQGCARWFDRQALHDAVIQRFGRAAFRECLRKILSSS